MVNQHMTQSRLNSWTFIHLIRLLLLILLFQASHSFYISSVRRHSTLLHSSEQFHTYEVEPFILLNSGTQNTEIESSVNTNIDTTEIEIRGPQLSRTIIFLVRAALIGIFTGVGIVLFKQAISYTGQVFYEELADILPKPAFYWPLALYPLLGSVFVSALTLLSGPAIGNGIDSIASTTSITMDTDLASAVNVTVSNRFQPSTQLIRLLASVFTLGSGCSLGPEGPSVEIGAGISRIVSGNVSSFHVSTKSISSPFDILCLPSTALEIRQLFLAGTSAAVAGAFSAPIAGIFFSIECGNRYLSKNTLPLIDIDQKGLPRADIAAVVLAATLSDLVVDWGLEGRVETLSLQGNYYAMESPLFELPLYLLLGLISGSISIAFSTFREFYSELFKGATWGSKYPISKLPEHVKPLLGGIVCGVVAVFYPQTLFTGYTTLDQVLSGKAAVNNLPMLIQLLFLKLQLTSFSLSAGLIGGVFAPSLFFGATAGAAYQNVISLILNSLYSVVGPILEPTSLESLHSFLSLASSPAYATVGAAATLGAIFRAPLTSSMLMFELTQNHDIVLPVLAATGVGGLFAEIIRHPRKQW